MKRNEKILASALGLVVAGYFGSSMIDSIFIAPVRELQDTADGLQSNVSTLGTNIVQLKVAERRLDTWARQGLPGRNPLDAQRLYQQWLSDVAGACGIDLAGLTLMSQVPAAGVYTTVPIEIKGKARFSELQSFMKVLHDVELLHRITRVNIPKAPASEGDPELIFDLTVEGLNVTGAVDRKTLFPQHTLDTDLPAKATTVTVPKKAFGAREGDLLRIGKELLKVSEVGEKGLTLKRGVEGSTASDHAVGAVAELLPLKREVRTTSEAAFASIKSPFVKLKRYQPAFDGFADQQLERGKSLQLTATVADYDRSAAAPKLELVDGPEGLKFNAETGEISWTPAADLPAGDYKVSLAADIAAPQKKLEKTITVKVTDPNTSPTIEEIKATEVFLGETLKVPTKATDAQDGSSLTYKVEQGPEGATVDPKGVFVWSVPQAFQPGEVSVTLIVADKGTPPMEGKHTFKINVREDLRPFVYITHTGSDTVQGKKTWKAWLTDRSSGRTMYLYEGKPFEAAGLSGLVKEIGDDFVTYERNSDIYKVGLGQNLKDARKLDSPVAEASPVAPAEAEKPTPLQPATAATDAPPNR